MEQNDKKRDWLTIIPIIFWGACNVFSIAKLPQMGEVRIIDVIDVINSNTFSTSITMVICMAYQFFTASARKQEEHSGLSRKYISVTIILTAGYIFVALANACNYIMPTTLAMLLYSGIYIIAFFKYMRK